VPFPQVNALSLHKDGAFFLDPTYEIQRSVTSRDGRLTRNTTHRYSVSSLGRHPKAPQRVDTSRILHSDEL